MRHPILIPVLLLGLTMRGIAQDKSEMWSAEADYVAANGRPAVEYVSGLFDAHDVVVIGEIHEVADNCRFVADLVDAVYKTAGVRVIASEFLRASQTEQMNALLTAEQWDESAATDLMRHGANVIWGYREYLDIFEAVWKVNHTLPADATTMRIVGLDSEWNQLAMLKEGSAAKRFKMTLDREHCMVTSLETAIATPGTKVLAHVGFAHSVTGQGERFATVLRRKYGDRVFQVALHHNFPGPGEVSPFTAMMEEILAGSPKPWGVTIKGSPLADLRRDDCLYFQMLGRGSSLDEAAEGYVFLTSVARLEPVSWIEGFVNQVTFEEAKELAIRMGRLGHEEDCPDAGALNEVLQKRLEERRPGPG